ncbi:uncharacterized protein LOC127698339 [Mytilus californianus]|uniref:uncharacterized protein LOC127698339 n=1 Tax=Mytilus californianus TaxID=6549 RepID=UPI0022483162|nr:uncharacterized protein LOC127698339 [Mytilus californianus]
MVMQFIQIFLFQCVMAYQDRCSQFIERYLRINYTLTRGECSEENPFHCLLKDNTETLKQSYYKNCKSWDWVSKGFHPVLRGKYIDYEKCQADRYQPFNFLSHENHQCYFVKSYCADEGQIEHRIGDETSDRTCKCDYTRRYAFHTIPRNKVFCIPSEEECTCFKKTCPTSQMMNEDYECVDSLVHSNQTEYSRNVTAVILIDDFDVISVSEISMWKTENFRIRFYLQIMLSGIILSNIIFTMYSFIYVAHRDLEKGHDFKVAIPVVVDENRVEKSSDSKEVKQGNTTVAEKIVPPDTSIDILLLTDNFGSLQLADSQSPKPEKSDDIDARKGKISVCETLNLPQDVDRTSDEYSKSKRYLKAMKNTDIVVLHVEDNISLKETNNMENTDSVESLQSFKDHLQTLADEWGYNHIKINFFEDVFVWCNYNNKISFTDVMDKCGMIFFYMSKKFLPGKLKRYGLSESSVNFALKALNDFPKVKIVCAYEQCKLYKKDFEIHLDYCKYKKSKDEDLYESTLREIFEKL